MSWIWIEPREAAVLDSGDAAAAGDAETAKAVHLNKRCCAHGSRLPPTPRASPFRTRPRALHRSYTRFRRLGSYRFCGESMKRMGRYSPFPTVRRQTDHGPVRAVRATSRSQRNGGYGADCGRSRGGPRRGAIRPIEPSAVPLRDGRFTSIRDGRSKVSNAQRAVIHRRLGERVKSTLSGPSRSDL